MTDLRTRLREADRMAAPDLWPHILTREPRGEPPPRFPWGQAATIAFAVGVAALAVSRGTIPPTVNWANRDDDCDLDYVPNEARRADVRLALSNSCRLPISRCRPT